MNKKTFVILSIAIISLTALVIHGLPSISAKSAPDILTEKAKTLGITPGTLEKTVFVHYANQHVNRSASPICYKLMGVKWQKLPIDYVINPAVENTVPGAITASTNAWDNATIKQLFGNYTIDETANWDNDTPDGRNEYSFGNYPQAGVIAVTIIWSGRPISSRTKQIIEYDVMFDTDFNWGDANTSATSSVMDLQNIATHEIGHGLGLSDIYNSSCSQVTMFGYSSNNETQKRTLEQPDVTGLQKMYGI